MRNKLKFLFVEPFYADSHKKWLDQLLQYTSHNITKLTLPGKFWKWRMHGAAITLAKVFLEQGAKYDLIICSSMLDVATFTSLIRSEIERAKIAIYFHENQLSYPWSPDDKDVELKRDRHYGFINYSSSLVADKLFFNSNYHKDSFIAALGPFLRAFPDFQNLETIKEIRNKSEVLPLGMDFSDLERHKVHVQNAVPLILWNHRWEFDKNPEFFFETLFCLKKEGLKFHLAVLGKEYAKRPKIFDEAKIRLADEIKHWGYVDDKKQYNELLWNADLLPVTSIQDFFGISVVEAIYCGTIPLLPNRLAYPQHLNEDVYYYASDEEFYRKLRSQIENHLQNQPPILSIILKYDWNSIIKKYDNAFEKIKAS